MKVCVKVIEKVVVGSSGFGVRGSSVGVEVGSSLSGHVFTVVVLSTNTVVVVDLLVITVVTLAREVMTVVTQ